MRNHSKKIFHSSITLKRTPTYNNQLMNPYKTKSKCSQNFKAKLLNNQPINKRNNQQSVKINHSQKIIPRRLTKLNLNAKRRKLKKKSSKKKSMLEI